MPTPQPFTFPTDYAPPADPAPSAYELNAMAREDGTLYRLRRPVPHKTRPAQAIYVRGSLGPIVRAVREGRAS